MAETVVIDCKNCKGSGKEKYCTGVEDTVGASRAHYSKRTCPKCDGIGKVKIRLSDIRDAE